MAEDQQCIFNVPGYPQGLDQLPIVKQIQIAQNQSKCPLPSQNLGSVKALKSISVAE